jgi:osmotically-inducible protein OsmY
MSAQESPDQSPLGQQAHTTGADGTIGIGRDVFQQVLAAVYTLQEHRTHLRENELELDTEPNNVIEFVPPAKAFRSTTEVYEPPDRMPDARLDENFEATVPAESSRSEAEQSMDEEGTYYLYQDEESTGSRIFRLTVLASACALVLAIVGLAIFSWHRRSSVPVTQSSRKAYSSAGKPAAAVASEDKPSVENTNDSAETSSKTVNGSQPSTNQRIGTNQENPRQLGGTGAPSGNNTADHAIASTVQERIRLDRRVRSKGVQASELNGIVTLAGDVNTQDERRAAQEDARVKGVKVVVDNLRLPGADPQRLPQGATTSVTRVDAHPLPSSGIVHAPIARNEVASGKDESKPPATIPYPSKGPLVSPRVVPASAPSIKATSAAISRPDPHKTSVAVASSSSANSTPVSAVRGHVTIPSGTALAVELADALSSQRNQRGDVFHANLSEPIMVGDEVAVPAGAGLMGTVLQAQTAGHYRGQPALVVQLTGIAYNGKNYQLRSDSLLKQGVSRSTRTVEVVGAGAGAGAIIGAIVGGGKGAAIGAAIGAGASGGIQAASKAAQVQLPVGARLRFQLETPLTVIPESSLTRESERISKNFGAAFRN